MATRVLPSAVQYTGLITSFPEGMYSGNTASARITQAIADLFYERGLPFRFVRPPARGATGFGVLALKQTPRLIGLVATLAGYLRKRHQRKSEILYASDARQVLGFEMQVLYTDGLELEEVQRVMAQSLELMQSVAARVKEWSGGTVHLASRISIFENSSTGAAGFWISPSALDDRQPYHFQSLSKKLVLGHQLDVSQGYWTGILRASKGRRIAPPGAPMTRPY